MWPAEAEVPRSSATAGRSKGDGDTGDGRGADDPLGVEYVTNRAVFVFVLGAVGIVVFRDVGFGNNAGDATGVVFS